MDTKTLFGIVGVLLVIAMFSNMISGTAQPTLTLGVNPQQGGTANVCGTGWLDGVICMAQGFIALLTYLFTSIVEFGKYLVALAFFFSGISVVVNGMGIPDPFGTIIGIFMTLAWVLVVADILGRLKAAIPLLGGR